MSLINDMLRDLEQRRKAETVTPPTTPTPVARQKKAGEFPLTLITGVGLIGLVMLLVFFGASLFSSPHQTLEPAPVSSVPEPLSRPDAEAGGTEVPGTLLSAPDELTSNADVTAGYRSLLSVLAGADQQGQIQLELVFDQLPEPALIVAAEGGSNILVRLKKTRIENGFVLPQPQTELVTSLKLVSEDGGLNLIVAVAPEHQVITTQALEPLASKLHIDMRFSAVNQAADRVDKDVLVVTPELKVAVPMTEPKSEAVPVPVPVAPTPALVRTQPVQDTEQQIYQRGLRQLQAGELAAAEKSFSETLRISPNRLQARLDLVGVLERLGDEQAAIRVILAGLQFTPAQPELRKRYARHLLLQQRYDDALEQLAAMPVPALNTDSEYHALRAAIYQERGNYFQAAQLYAQLLQQHPQEALWWMGLAISLEQQGQFDGARDAYRTALDVSGLRPDLEHFVRDRLQML